MRKVWILAAVMAGAVSGCVFPEYGEERSRTIGKGYDVEEEKESAVDTSSRGERHIYVTAVEVPQDYDWRRDTASGNVRGRLILYRDYEPLLELETGHDKRISADHDMHHIIGCHLFTEFSTSDSTFIMRDGLVIVSFKGRELLLGIVEYGGSLYTLGRYRDGSGFSFRRDGEVLVSRASCEVSGSMTGERYGEGGALFEDEGDICFFYKDTGGEEFVVRAGSVRVASSEDLALKTKYRTVWMEGDYILYRGLSFNWLLRFTRDGGVLTVAALKQIQLGNNLYFFSTQCAAVVGDDIYLVLSSRDDSSPSSCWSTAERREKVFNIDGYLTGIACVEE